MYMLNTGICIHVLRRHPGRLLVKFKEVSNLCISSITYAELCFGIESGAAAMKSERWEQLSAFVQLLRIKTVGHEVGRHYGYLRSLVGGQGLFISHNELWIAAHARSLGAVLVTNNLRDFSRLPDLTVENWF